MLTTIIINKLILILITIGVVVIINTGSYTLFVIDVVDSNYYYY